MPDDLARGVAVRGTETGRHTVKSLVKMLAVLECFTNRDRELSVVEIARRTRLPRTTVHRIVDSLRVVGLVEQEASRERYRLGIKLFQLGSTALTNLPLYREAPPFVDTLSKLSGETVHLCVFDGNEMVFVERAGPDKGRPNNTVTTMEATPCHSTGVGKAALAFQEAGVIERIIGQGLQPFTGDTIVEPDALREELRLVRERGYAMDNGEHEPDVRCVAAPIRNSAGKVFAGISVSGSRQDMTDGRVARFVPLVVSHATLISMRLGMTAPGWDEGG